jgi:hypothetical protein
MSNNFDSVTLQNIIKSYVYQEYSDDDDVQAFVASYNQIAQQALDFFNQLNYPVYTQPNITGAFLDWVANGLYGIQRPVASSTQIGTIGPFNTYAYNSWPFDRLSITSTVSYEYISDDLFKRIITWNFYKGDGQYFNTKWLKRRIVRFLGGPNGVDVSSEQISNTTQVSVVVNTDYHVVINIYPGELPLTFAPIIGAGIAEGFLETPFQYQYEVIIHADLGEAPLDLFILDLNILA